MTLIDTIPRSDLLDDEPSAPDARLAVTDLRIGFRIDGTLRPIVHGVSLELHPGQCVALVGESGSGKSVTARALVGLAGRGAVVDANHFTIEGRDARRFDSAQWRRVRGAQIGFVLQDALVSLDPLRSVGAEIDEALRVGGRSTRAERRVRILELLRAVGVPNPEVRARQRPDELSGGLRQRALIATAIARDPGIVIADEPTTALDVTVQAQVLRQLESMRDRGAAVLLISHDLSVVARLADHIIVLREGRVVEQGSAAQVLGDPQHEYTRTLIAAVPGVQTRGSRLSVGGEAAPVPEAAPASVPGSVLTATDRPQVESTAESGPVLRARGLVKSYPSPSGGRSTVVRDVDLDIARGETLGIVGESGSGKSTTAALVLGLDDADAGTVELQGRPWAPLLERARRARRGLVTVVDQDPLSSFDPRWNVERILLDALPADVTGRAARRARVSQLLEQVGLGAEVGQRFPLRLSGGQRQRVAIARALAPRPRLIVLDEAVSALDVTIQAQILDLLVDLQRETAVSYLFISHDLGVVGHLCDRILVMKDGVVVEEGASESLLADPQHPYTRELIASIPPFAPRTARTDQKGPHRG